MFTGTEFLIGIGVLVVISAIGSVFMLKKPYEPWKIRHVSHSSFDTSPNAGFPSDFTMGSMSVNNSLSVNSDDPFKD